MMLLLFILWMMIQKYEARVIIPILQQYKSNISSRAGSTVQLHCPITVSQEMSMGFYISWTVNGIDENMLSVDVRYQFKDSNKILEVSKLRSDDSGIYVCKGVTGYGVKEAAFYLTVKDEEFCPILENQSTKRRFKPCFLNSLMQKEDTYQKIIRDIGSSVEFDCSAVGSPPPKYLWMKEKSSTDWIENITGIRQPILRINYLLVEYSGYYTCKVSNSVGEISYTYTLIVREKRSKIPKIINEMGNISVNVGAQAMLVGSVTCNCKPSLQWLKRIINRTFIQKEIPIPNARISEKNEFYIIIDPENTNNPIDTSEKYNDVLVSVLKFKRVVPSDAGKYILFATNGDYGMNYGVTYLEVQGNPEPSKMNHPKLVLYIAIPIIILILCFGIIFYCWSRRHSTQRVECPKRFCVGSSSITSSTQNKSIRNHYPGSVTNTSGTTGKCSNNSSILGNKVPVNDNFHQHISNNIPLLSQNNTNRPLSPNFNGVEIIQKSEIMDPNLIQSAFQNLSQNENISPYSYSKIPVQKVVFPVSNSRISNTSQPNTHSGSSNCSNHTNRSYSNHVPLQSQPTYQQNIPPQLFNSIPLSIPQYIIPTSLDYGFNNQITINDQSYPQFCEEVMQVPNLYYAQDYNPVENLSNHQNTYSFS